MNPNKFAKKYEFFAKSCKKTGIKRATMKEVSNHGGYHNGAY